MGAGFASLAFCFGREEVPGAIKQAGGLSYLEGMAKRSKKGDKDLLVEVVETGVVVDMDPKDAKLTYKLHFLDGASDWFPESEVELVGKPFAVVVLPTTGSQFEIADLKVNDKLSVLFGRVAKELHQPQSKIVLSSGSRVFEEGDMNRCLALLGLGEGAPVHCLVSNYDIKLLRLECASEKIPWSDGQLETWTVKALIYGRKGSPAQRLLWADWATSVGLDHTNAKRMDAFISEDSISLNIATGDKSRSLPISKLIADWPQPEKSSSMSLNDQFKAKFGNHTDWPRILGPCCRKIE